MENFFDINIEGKSITRFSSFTLTQSIFEHHQFRLICPSETIDGTFGSIFNSSKTLVGNKIAIQINPIGSINTLQFAGVITQIETSRYSSHTGDIIISGYSSTILLDSGPHCKSWEKKAIKNIAQDILKHFPQNLLNAKVSPNNGETISYIVQYKETAWQFLNRLSAIYGQWLYFDGHKLILGSPDGGKAHLLFGSNLENFNMALQVRPSKFQMMAYDYLNNEVYNGTPTGIAAKAGLNDLGKYALQRSEQFYGTQPKQWNNHFLTNKKQLDDHIATRAAMQSSNMVRFNGNSSHAGIILGGTISVEGKNVFNGLDESFGEYTVISVNHHCDGESNYTNEFEAIPASVKVPPISVYGEPHCETQSAIVTDNHDPKGLGRIRVKFHWMNGVEKTPWIRVTSPHGGGGKGMFFIPEMGEEVIVGFEGDSAIKPYVIGTVYHGKANNSYSNSGNDVKALQTRSGNKVVMNDKDGSVHVQDSKGNDMMMDGAGNINVKSSESIVFTCGDSSISLKKDGTIEIHGKKSVLISGDSDSVTVTSNTLIELDSKATVEVTGTQSVSVESKAQVGISAPATAVEGKATLKLESKGIVDIDGTTMTNVKGGIVNLN